MFQASAENLTRIGLALSPADEPPVARKHGVRAGSYDDVMVMMSSKRSYFSGTANTLPRAQTSTETRASTQQRTETDSIAKSSNASEVETTNLARYLLVRTTAKNGEPCDGIYERLENVLHENSPVYCQSNGLTISKATIAGREGWVLGKGPARILYGSCKWGCQDLAGPSAHVIWTFYGKSTREKQVKFVQEIPIKNSDSSPQQNVLPLERQKEEAHGSHEKILQELIEQKDQDEVNFVAACVDKNALLNEQTIVRSRSRSSSSTSSNNTYRGCMVQALPHSRLRTRGKVVVAVWKGKERGAWISALAYFEGFHFRITDPRNELGVQGKHFDLRDHIATPSALRDHIFHLARRTSQEWAYGGSGSGNYSPTGKNGSTVRTGRGPSDSGHRRVLAVDCGDAETRMLWLSAFHILTVHADINPLQVHMEYERHQRNQRKAAVAHTSNIEHSKPTLNGKVESKNQASVTYQASKQEVSSVFEVAGQTNEDSTSKTLSIISPTILQNVWSEEAQQNQDSEGVTSNSMNFQTIDHESDVEQDSCTEGRPQQGEENLSSPREDDTTVDSNAGSQKMAPPRASMPSPAPTSVILANMQRLVELKKGEETAASSYLTPSQENDAPLGERPPPVLTPEELAEHERRKDRMLRSQFAQYAASPFQ